MVLVSNGEAWYLGVSGGAKRRKERSKRGKKWQATCVETICENFDREFFEETDLGWGPALEVSKEGILYESWLPALRPGLGIGSGQPPRIAFVAARTLVR